MYFTTTLMASLVVSASALATPQLHGLHRRHHHAALAKARAPAPEPAPVSFAPSAAIPNKQLRKRCSGRRKHSPASTSSDAAATPSSPHTSAAAAASPPSAAPVNVAPLPDSTSSSTSDSPKASPSPDHTSSHDPAPSSTPTSDGSQSAGSFSGTHTGDGTFYGTGLGACGVTNVDTDDIVAVSKGLFDTFPGFNGVNPNTNPVCKLQIKATFNGKSVVVNVVDRCVGCSEFSLDFSPHAFNQLADPSVGRIHGMSWEFL